MFKTILHRLDDCFPSFGMMARRRLRGEVVRGLHQKINGQDNTVETLGTKFSNVEMDISGDRNQVVFGEGSEINNLKIRIRGSDHRIEMGKNCRVIGGGVFWVEDNHCLLRVGMNTTMVEASISVTEPDSKVIIGPDCMFANDIDIRVGDSHSVIDVATGKRINFAENITIGSHVWIAAHSVILKGVSVGENSVVASGAIVTRSCEPGTILAGNPAKAIKTGITWNRDRILKNE